jgi:RNA polymerase sigma factor (sigma-70 family)
MPANPATLLRHLRRLAAPAPLTPDADAVLLGRFVRDRDEGAFAALVRRHGPMVRRVCRRVLADPGLADDAFQATFLVLARRAAAVRSREALASWLHGVAYRVARKARAAGARRQLREVTAPGVDPPDPRPDPLAEVSAREVLTVVDEEVQRLPEAYRLPVILCCMEGQSREEAARVLGWTPGSVKGRLERGRARLHARLVRRGLTLSAALAAVEASRGGAPAGVPGTLADETARAALACAAGRGAAGAMVSERVVLLAEAGLRATPVGKVALAALLLAAGLVLAGTGAVALQLRAAKPPEREHQREPEALPKGAADLAPQAQGQAHTDRFDDPLPPGAIARLGTNRWNHSLRADGFGVVTISPDGATVASTSGPPWGARLWETDTGRSLGWLKPDLDVRAALFTPDGKTLLTASPRKRVPPSAGGCRWDIQHWEAGTGKLQRRAEISVSGVMHDFVEFEFPQFSRDGKFFLAKERHSGESKKVVLWDAATGKQHAAVEQKTTAWNPLAVSPDGSVLAVAGQDDRLYLHQLPDGRLLHALPRAGEMRGNGHYAPAFSPDGKTLVTSGPRSLLLWDVAGGKLRNEVKDLRGVAAFSPDGKHLACGGRDAIHLLDAATLQEVRRFEPLHDDVLALAFSADGRRLVSGQEYTVGVWDVATGKRLNASPGHDVPVYSLAFAPDGRSLASGGGCGVFGDGDAVAIVWDLKTGRPRHRFTGHLYSVASLAFSPDGKTLATGDGAALRGPGIGRSSTEGRVRLWDLGRGRLVREFPAHLGGVCDLGFSPDGKALATAGGDARFRVWDAATGERRFQVRDADRQDRSVCFSPDDRALLGPGAGSRLALWDSTTGEKVRDIGPSEDVQHPVRFAAFAEGGKAVLSLDSNSNRCDFWDAQTGKALRSAEAQQGSDIGQPIHDTALSPDGTTLAMGVYEGGKSAVLLWDVDSGRPLTTLSGPAGGVTAVAFSPDGKTLASGGGDTSVLLWDVTQARLEALWDGLRSAGGPAHPPADRARAVALLKERLKEAAAAEKRVPALLTDLDDDSYDKREKATEQLTRLGAAAEPPLREALKGMLSAEAEARVRRVLDALAKRSEATPDDGRRLERAVQALEAINTDEARQALRDLAGGDKGLTVTRLAAEALERLGRPGRPR